MLNETVHDIATLADLKAGQSARSVCPLCNATHEKSFKVRVDPYAPWKIWYRCYRASCGVYGYVTLAGNITMSVAADDIAQADRVEQTYQPIPTPQLDALQQAWGIKDKRVLAAQGVRYDPLTDIIAYPWLNWDPRLSTSYQVGWQLRHRTEKDITNFRTDSEAHHYSLIHRPAHRNYGWQEIVLVESLRSCYVLLDACMEREDNTLPIALLGHTLSSAVVEQWRKHGVQRAVVLLDPDTWPNAALKVIRTLEAGGIAAEGLWKPVKPYALPYDELREIGISNTQF